MDLKPFIAQAKIDLAVLVAIDTVSAQGRNLEVRLGIKTGASYGQERVLVGEWGGEIGGGVV